MRILVTNDDGVHADGLFALYQALSQVGDVTVVAPERQQSATGHAITLHKPLRMTPTTLQDGSPAFMSNGTPSDCATLGILEAMGSEVDLVVSGINHGPNLGWDIHYSGNRFRRLLKPRLSANRRLPFPSLPGTKTFTGNRRHSSPPEWRFGSSAIPCPRTPFLISMRPTCPSRTFKASPSPLKARRQYVDRIEKRLDPLGRPYYWLGGSLAEEAAGAEVGSDVRAVAEGKMSLTPVHLDLTAYALMPSLKEWDSDQRR